MTKAREHPIGFALCCIPLKIAVGLICVLELFISVVASLLMITGDGHFIVGGYPRVSEILVVTVGLLGLAACSYGLVGLKDGDTGHVRTFLHFLLLHFIAVIVVWALDYSVLVNCESYTGGLGSYNVALGLLVQKGLCGRAVAWRNICSVIQLILILYGAWITSRWIWTVEQAPAFLVAFDERTPVRTYLGYLGFGHRLRKEPSADSIPQTTHFGTLERSSGARPSFQPAQPHWQQSLAFQGHGDLEGARLVQGESQPSWLPPTSGAAGLTSASARPYVSSLA